MYFSLWGLEGGLQGRTKGRGQQEPQQSRVVAEMHSNWFVGQRQEREREGLRKGDHWPNIGSNELALAPAVVGCREGSSGGGMWWGSNGGGVCTDTVEAAAVVGCA